MATQRYHIVGYNMGQRFYLTNQGWVQRFDHRGLYSKTRASCEIAKARNRNCFLDPDEQITDIQMTNEKEKVT